MDGQGAVRNEICVPHKNVKFSVAALCLTVMVRWTFQYYLRFLSLCSRDSKNKSFWYIIVDKLTH